MVSDLPPVQGHLDTDLLRSFVAVAEERHFSRAAARVHLSQQAVSRHIQRLEGQLHVALFVRSTRRVELTGAGQTLLVGARRLLALHEDVVHSVRGDERPLVVDGLAEGLSPDTVLDRARRADPSVEYVARYAEGGAAVLENLARHRVDVGFGRAQRRGSPFDDERFSRRLVRLEPVGLLLPDEHPWARRSSIPSDDLRGLEIDGSAGNALAPEWTDLADEFFELVGARPCPPHLHAAGPQETAIHLARGGSAILTMTQTRPVPGATVVPITAPTPLYPWAMMHATDLRDVGLDQLHRACERLAHEDGWLTRPPDSWLPAAES